MFWTACVSLSTWTKAKNAHARFDFHGAIICGFEGGFKSRTYTSSVRIISFMVFVKLLILPKNSFWKIYPFPFSGGRVRQHIFCWIGKTALFFSAGLSGQDTKDRGNRFLLIGDIYLRQDTASYPRILTDITDGEPQALPLAPQIACSLRLQTASVDRSLLNIKTNDVPDLMSLLVVYSESM